MKIEKERFSFFIDFFAKSISISYFQWSEMYQAALKNDKNFLEEQFSMLKRDYEEVIDITIVSVQNLLEGQKWRNIEDVQDFLEDTQMYHISSSRNVLKILFKISDSNVKSFVNDKLVLVTVNPDKILERLKIKNVTLSEKGRTFAYNLRYTRKMEVMDFIVLFSSTFIFSSLFAIYLLLIEINLKKKEEVYGRALNAIAELSNSLLKGELELSYQLLLDNAVKIIPGAQAGSVLTRDKDGDFIFSAVAGFDFKLLSLLKLKPYELAQGYEKEIKIIKKIGEFDKKNLPENKRELLKNIGKTSEIKATLSIPITIQDEIVAFLNLDNMKSENAFSALSIDIAKVFAKQIGVIFERIKLENELKEQKEKLEYISLHDPLTELPNRRFVEMEGERLIALANRENKKICLIYVDLKKFKPVNDKYGHQVGDYVLKVVGGRLKNVVRKSDIVGRIGGDEFVFLLYDCKDYQHFVDRVLSELEKEIYYGYTSIQISANFGIGIYPDDASTFDELIAKSDMAMYFAKSSNIKYYLASKLNITFEN